MKTDYQDLEGKYLDYVADDLTIRAKVIGADYHVGITVVALYNLNQHLICLNRKTHVKNWGKTKYRKAFHAYIKAIQSGTYIAHTAHNRDRKNLPMAPCAFE